MGPSKLAAIHRFFFEKLLDETRRNNNILPKTRLKLLNEFIAEQQRILVVKRRDNSPERINEALIRHYQAFYTDVAFINRMQAGKGGNWQDQTNPIFKTRLQQFTDMLHDSNNPIHVDLAIQRAWYPALQAGRQESIEAIKSVYTQASKDAEASAKEITLQQRIGWSDQEQSGTTYLSDRLDVFTFVECCLEMYAHATQYGIAESNLIVQIDAEIATRIKALEEYVAKVKAKLDGIQDRSSLEYKTLSSDYETKNTELYNVNNDKRTQGVALIQGTVKAAKTAKDNFQLNSHNEKSAKEYAGKYDQLLQLADRLAPFKPAQKTSAQNHSKTATSTPATHTAELEQETSHGNSWLRAAQSSDRTRYKEKYRLVFDVQKLKAMHTPQPTHQAFDFTKPHNPTAEEDFLPFVKQVATAVPVTLDQTKSAVSMQSQSKESSLIESLKIDNTIKDDPRLKDISSLIETFNKRVSERFQDKDESGMKPAKYKAMHIYSQHMTQLLADFCNNKVDKTVDGNIKIFKDACLAEAAQLYVAIRRSGGNRTFGFKGSKLANDFQEGLMACSVTVPGNVGKQEKTEDIIKKIKIPKDVDPDSSTQRRISARIIAAGAMDNVHSDIASWRYLLVEPIPASTSQASPEPVTDTPPPAHGPHPH